MFTSSSVLASFSYIIELVPIHLLAYYPFRDRLRFPAWLVYSLVSLNLSAEFIVCCYLYSKGQDIRNMDIFFALVSFTCYFSCVETEVPKLLFVYILITDYVMIVRGIAIFLTIRFFADSSHSYVFLGAPSDTIIRMIPNILTLPLILHFITDTKEQVLKSNAPQLWSTFWLLPALTTIIVLMATWNVNMISISGLTFLLARVCLLISVIIIYHTLLSSLESIRLQGETEERARNQEQLISLQKFEYARMQKQIEEIRQARHDLHQHLNMIQAYLDKGDNDSLRDYIQKYGKKLPSNSQKTYCLNYAVDTIVRYYAEKAEESDIVFHSHILLPKDLSVEEPDICILFGNLLENAVDSCCIDEEKERFIRVHARIAGESAISITVDNSCSHRFIEKNNQILSSKHSGSGIGTLSIRNIAEQYKGIADFKYEDGVFYASVFLNP